MIEDVVLCGNDSLYINGTWINTSGIYVEHLLGCVGQDSIVNYNVSLVPSVSNDVLIDPIAGSLTAKESIAMYQWYQCIGGLLTPIIGATNATFFPQQNGDYAVVVDKNGCVDTSACTNVTFINIQKLEKEAIQLYPNPTRGTVVLEFGAIQENIKVQFFAANGQRLLYEISSNKKQLQYSIHNFSAGMYWIEVNTGDKIQRFKLIKQ